MLADVHAVVVIVTLVKIRTMLLVPLSHWRRTGNCVLSGLGTSMQRICSRLARQCTRSRFSRAQDRFDYSRPVINTFRLSSKAFLNVLDAIEEFKYSAATESIRAGLAVARKRGVRLGRPETVNAHRGNVARLRAKGLPGRAIAKELNISSSKVFKLIKGQ
jgi:hypothetical protein